MGYNKENYVRIRQEYADKNLRAKEAAKKRAEDRLDKKDPGVDVVRAEAALKRAMARLSAVGK